MGEGCERLLAELIQGVKVDHVQCDEIRSWIRCKERTKESKRIADPDAGDAYTFVALCRQNELALAWHLGRRNSWGAHDFVAKVGTATSGDLQLSTDGWNGYPNAVEFNLGARVDYGINIKEFRSEGGVGARLYSPPRLISCRKRAVSGTPDQDRICTSHVERCNWTMRTHLRRLTRPSSGFSRKRANLRTALALFFAYYNLVKFHRSIK